MTYYFMKYIHILILFATTDIILQSIFTIIVLYLLNNTSLSIIIFAWKVQFIVKL